MALFAAAKRLARACVINSDQLRCRCEPTRGKRAGRLPAAQGPAPSRPARARRLPYMIPTRVGTPIGTQILERLKAAAGPGAALDDPADMAPYCKSFRDGWEGHVPLVLRPQTTSAVAEVVRICAEAGIGVVPQGGNTGLTGGSQPHADMSEI